jgi:hypothetical protein
VAAKKTIKQLSDDVIKLSDELNLLNTQLSGLKKGSDEYTKTLISVIKSSDELNKSADTLAKSSVYLSTTNKNHTAAVNASDNALKRFSATQKQTTRVIKDAGAADTKRVKVISAALDAEKKERGRHNKYIRRLQNRHLDQLESDRRAAAKKAASGAAKEAKRNDFTGAFTGSFTPQKLGSTLGTVTRFLGVGTAVFSIVEGLKQITIESFKTFTRLEQQFASLSAISGASAEQMLKVRDVTFEVASGVGYSTDEVIQLQTALVKLGIPIEEVSVSIKSIAIAAKAMGEDLSNVGETVFRVSNQFGLSTQEIAATSSVLVRAVNESALTFQEFGTAIQYVGPVAKQAGLDFNETAGYMQVLSNAGFKASKIGTGLRDIFIDLKQPGETLTQTISRLSKENIGLSEAVDLVGKTSASQLLVLMRNAEELEKFSQITNVVKELEKDLSNLLVQNSKQMDTNAGRIGSLGVAWEAYSFRIGQAITLTEGFLDLLGLLDARAEATARAYKVLSGLTEQQAGNAVGSFARSGTQYQQAQVAAGTLSAAQRENLRKFYSTNYSRDKKDFSGNVYQKAMSFEKYIQGISTGTIRTQTGEERALFGVYKELSNAAVDLRKSEEALTIRRKQSAKFSTEFTAVEAASGTRRLQLADSLRKKLEAEEVRLQKKIETSTSDSEKRKNEIQLEAAKDRSQQLAELVSGEEERLKDKQKAQDKTDRETEEGQRKEVERLRDIIEERKREYQELVDSLEIDKQLALAKGDLNEAARIEALLIKTRSKSYAELTEAINQNKIITADQKFDLLGNIKNFKVNEKDIKESVENIVKVYKEAISAKGLMQGVQVGDAVVEQFILSIENSIGELPESEKQKIRELINSLVFPDLATDPKFSSGKKGKLGIDSDDFKVELAKAIQGVAQEVYAGLREISDVKFDNLIGGLEREKDAIKERYDYEQKVLEAQVENQLITQDEYERKLEQIQKRRIQKENQVNKKIFESEKSRDRKDASLEFVETLASLSLNNFKKYDTVAAIILTAIGTAAAGTQYGLKLSAINQREFFPVKYAEGGVVNGPSHAEGGVPFTVKGRGGYEMEGGEFIVNKEATKRNYSLLRQINDSVKPSTYSVGRKFAAGGMVNAEEISVRQIELLENIAYATGGTYINTGKPVRAFVSSDDLRKSDVDLRVRERNSNL